MRRILVTGAAGFVGSQVCEALLTRPDTEVVGLDAFIPYYPRARKEANLAAALRHERFSFHELDLRTDALDRCLGGCEAVIHLAAMPGLVRSWSDFSLYATCNIEGTQRLLDAARARRVGHFIYGSTSSVYGREATRPETTEPRPYSPYGLTKLAGEHLCRAYEANFGLPVTILRLFSVYGPRQRPDMAYHILIDALLNGRGFVRYGDGEQTRSNTFVDDCVDGILRAADRPDVSVGEVFNIGGGEVVTLNRVIALLEELTGQHAMIEQRPERPGDQRHTRAEVGKARERLGYSPSTPVATGLRAQVEWMRAQPDRAG